MGLMDLKKAELVALAEKHDLDSSGTKADLVERLEGVVDWDESDDSDAEESAPSSDDFDISELLSEGEDLQDEDFVKLAYEKILRREADRAGLKHYSACIWFHKTMSREDVCKALLDSTEYKSMMASIRGE